MTAGPRGPTAGLVLTGARHPEEHQPSVLDLRAVERDLHQTWPDGQGLHVMYEHATALLVHVRALRAVLEKARNTPQRDALPLPAWVAMCEEIAAVLGAAQDGDGGP